MLFRSKAVNLRHILLSVPNSARRASTSTSGLAPGIPFTPLAPSSFMDVKMPDMSARIPLPQPQIPYMPDFWESSVSRDADNASEMVLPKLSVLAEPGTASHNLLDASLLAESTSSSSVASPSSVGPDGQNGLLEDIAEDLGLPSPKAMKRAVSNLFQNFK
ncbi:unnamed protein product [Mycena citricolor]|uniref:Uncharacterized protein n=1 Tax=Mycena citricolor TaxID=2018698 RepID=A0AAD2HMR8_9AGAR|nr:unnamed protein product [Mycena citricolor]